MNSLILLLVLFAIAAGLLLYQAMAKRRRQPSPIGDRQSVSPPDAHGWAIETEYRPTQEIGGDFYQVLPIDKNEVLVVVGDVSGKGLKADLVIENLTRLLRAHRNRSPALLCIELNRALAGSLRGGMVSCLIARLAPDGRVTLANAGHLAPIGIASPIDAPVGRPLGVTPDSEYTECEFQLASGDGLLLITNGVVDAVNPSGERFGLDRVQALTAQTAQQIAATARQWGQLDDITVVTIRRTTS